MTDLIVAAFSPINLFYTTLFAFVLLYWITVFVGFLDFSSLDIDIDVDADIDVDVDVDADVDADASTGGGTNLFLAFLAFFNIGKIPFMIFMSFFALFIWVIGILGNHYIGQNTTSFGLIWVLPSLFSSLFLTKFVTQPLKNVFKDEENEFKGSEDVIGKVCTAKLPVDDDSIAQAEVPTKLGAPLTIKVKATEQNEIPKGEKGLVVDYDKETNVYIVEPFFD